MKFSKAVTFDYFHGFASLIIGFCMCTYVHSISVCVCVCVSVMDVRECRVVAYLKCMLQVVRWALTQ